MPLILITGFPCSGKSHRANQLLANFQSRIQSATESKGATSVLILPSDHASLDPSSSLSPSEEPNSYTPPDRPSNPRDRIYNSATLEKTARAEEFSAIKRALSKNSIVIADGLNYIKGFRYQIWCEAKAVGTRCVVVHAAAREDECIIWNNDRLKAWAWEVEEEAEDAVKQRNANTWTPTGPKVGRDVLGDLMPESHTAIYGDRLGDGNGTRSRSSSMGGGSDSDADERDGAEKTKKAIRPPAEDTMTLKSLYIHDRADSATTSTTLQHISEVTTNHDDGENTALLPSPTSSLPYSPATLRSLTMRYEPPSPFSRWDTPLFTVPSSDAHPPYDTIWTAMFPTPTKNTSKKALATQPRSDATSTPDPTTARDTVRPNLSTLLPQATGTNALQILESATADVVRSLLSAARSAGLVDGTGGTVDFQVTTTTGSSSTDAYDLSIDLPMGTVLSQPLLQRLRRKYTQIQRGGLAHGQGYVRDREDIVRGFVRFLEGEWDV